MKRIRIGNGCGFWGDSVDAPINLVRDGHLDYLTLEYLAELTMSILALQKQRDPNAGFASDFIEVLSRLTPLLIQQPRLKIVTNAGGMNPMACALQAKAVLDKAGIRRRIFLVSGDDIFSKLEEILKDPSELKNLDTGHSLETIRSKVVSANTYLGAQPIARALESGADIVITGRVADASLTVGPAIAEFGWAMNDFDRLSAATVAGHLIECGAQATGGIWTHWQEAEPLDTIGYPIAEIDESGVFQISKPPHTGGAINLETISEQLLYEVGDPAAYLTPDVVSDFTSVRLKQLSRDVVQVSDVQGKPATPFYKVSIAFRDGFSSGGTLVIPGARAAKRAGEILLARLRHAGFSYQRSYVEVLPGPTENSEAYLRVSVHDPNKAAVERFTREFAPLVTSGPQGVSGYTTGRAAVREVFAYWPALIRKELVEPKVEELQ
jgi:hypothetical protein